MHEREAAERMSETGRRPPRGVRNEIDQFIARHALAWEVTFAVLAIVYVGMAIVGDSATGELARLLDIAEPVLTTVFVVEFVGRLWAAPNRRSHLRRHWIDAVSLVPAVRAFRILRVLRLLRVFSGVYRAGMDFEKLAQHRAFLSVVISWLALGTICSIAFFAAESGSNPSVKSAFDALWWAVGSLSTIGSEIVPGTPEGRFAAMLLEIFGVFLFSAITATITSFLIAQPSESSKTGLSGELARVSDLHAGGRLTDDEFAAAKARLLQPAG
jgi:voltage-gated potassium channel